MLRTFCCIGLASFAALSLAGAAAFGNTPAPQAPATHLVIVAWSAWPEAWVDANAEEAAAFFGGVIHALKASRPHLAGRSAP